MKNIVFSVLLILIFASCSSDVDYRKEILNKKWSISTPNGTSIYFYLDSTTMRRYNYRPEVKNKKMSDSISIPFQNPFNGKEGWDTSLHYNRFKILNDTLLLISENYKDTTKFKIRSISGNGSSYDKRLEMVRIDGYLHKGEEEFWFTGN